MIGGNDLVILTTLSPALARTAALVYLRNLWPDGKLEADDATDFFYYKDAESHAAWNGTSADPTKHSMVYVLPRNGHVTFVHNGLDEEDVKRTFETAETPPEN